MAGVWSSLITLKVGVEVVVVGAADVGVGVIVMVVARTSVMSVVKLVILHENVACVLVHEAWVVDDVEAQVHDAVGAPVMAAGLLVHMERSLPDVAAYHPHLAVAVAIAGHPHLAVLIMIQLM
ncbi:hypothetical protein [Escherichia coli]|uniref:hypothetical protein n=1 Tax=Escherichia coli TaxID=562 RepID=UPI00200F287D|nr:hypothetical protein [Escherichia coli]